jgi:hypothetical protein
MTNTGDIFSINENGILEIDIEGNIQIELIGKKLEITSRFFTTTQF